MKGRRFGGVLTAAAAMVVMVSACGTGGGAEAPNGSSGEAQSSQSSALSAESIVAAVEPNGFECEEVEPGLDDREKDIAAFDKAMGDLGLDWTEDLC